MRHLKPRDSIFTQSSALTLRSITTVRSTTNEWFPLVLIPYTTSRMKRLIRISKVGFLSLYQFTSLYEEGKQRKNKRWKEVHGSGAGL
ncbi:hypothetical protein CIPAW_08G030200 [Carya illinoinensis]|uniref:Uncharacterized protein n=1 Tax=Carya illinoinensis TaxID=32201 RepID=A0A8T1PUT9_CARIL|nr:hypothetical protein CIPAW_08G030200 [Carya illinoinensis]